jgi:hypothetical protein
MQKKPPGSVNCSALHVVHETWPPRPPVRDHVPSAALRATTTGTPTKPLVHTYEKLVTEAALAFGLGTITALATGGRGGRASASTSAAESERL